jgi:fructose-1,6-bisphosphatase I/sedoheptulose-1,7-bisphosphatase
MPYRRTTLSKFLIETQRRAAKPEPELASLLSDVQTACKLIAVAASRGSLEASANPLDAVSNTIMVATCEWGGQLSGMVSKEMESPYPIPPKYPRGRFLLVFDPLDGASNIDVNAPVGTISRCCAARMGWSSRRRPISCSPAQARWRRDMRSMGRSRCWC